MVHWVTHTPEHKAEQSLLVLASLGCNSAAATFASRETMSASLIRGFILVGIFAKLMPDNG